MPFRFMTSLACADTRKAISLLAASACRVPLASIAKRRREGRGGPPSRLRRFDETQFACGRECELWLGLRDDFRTWFVQHVA